MVAIVAPLVRKLKDVLRNFMFQFGYSNRSGTQGKNFEALGGWEPPMQSSIFDLRTEGENFKVLGGYREKTLKFLGGLQGDPNVNTMWK